MIDVAPSDFLRIPGNRGLIRMLKALEEAEQLSTMRAGEQVFNSRHYGCKVLMHAKELGLITRPTVPREGAAIPTL